MELSILGSLILGVSQQFKQKTNIDKNANPVQQWIIFWSPKYIFLLSFLRYQYTINTINTHIIKRNHMIKLFIEYTIVNLIFNSSQCLSEYKIHTNVLRAISGNKELLLKFPQKFMIIIENRYWRENYLWLRLSQSYFVRLVYEWRLIFNLASLNKLKDTW